MEGWEGVYTGCILYSRQAAHGKFISSNTDMSRVGQTGVAGPQIKPLSVGWWIWALPALEHLAERLRAVRGESWTHSFQDITSHGGQPVPTLEPRAFGKILDTQRAGRIII